jgi:hypothetical protein
MAVNFAKLRDMLRWPRVFGDRQMQILNSFRIGSAFLSIFLFACAALSRAVSL